MARTILIGFDETDGAGRALDRAIAEAKESGDRLAVLTVFEMMFDPEGPQSFGNINHEARMMPLVEPPELEPILAKAKAQVEAAGIDADYVWAAGNASEKITSAARDREARLVVLSSHHHGFFARLVGDDVAAEVKRELGDLDVDVIIVD